LPLQWTELKLKERPLFRVVDFAEWRNRLRRDPWEAMSKATARLKL
jgi:bifunctional non-homologous end joining protein LigD